MPRLAQLNFRISEPFEPYLTWVDSEKVYMFLLPLRIKITFLVLRDSQLCPLNIGRIPAISLNMAPSVLEKAVQAQKDKAVFPLPRPTDGTKAYRVEIDEFLADNAMTNLFLIALKELQDESLTVPKTKESNWWSFYSLAGLLPNTRYPGITTDSSRYPWSAKRVMGRPRKRWKSWLLSSRHAYFSNLGESASRSPSH